MNLVKAEYGSRVTHESCLAGGPSRRMYPLLKLLITFTIGYVFGVISTSFKDSTSTTSSSIVNLTVAAAAGSGLEMQNCVSAYVSFVQEGRLGNWLFQFAAAYSVARDTCKRVHLTESNELLSIFPALRQDKHIYVTKTDVQFSQQRTIGDPKICGFAPSVIESTRGHYNINMHGYYQSWRYFHEYRDELLVQLRFNDSIQAEADRQLEAIRTKVLAKFAPAPDKLTWISVHIRRGDIVFRQQSHGYMLATPEYLQESASYFVRKYGEPRRGVVFLVFSDDQGWSKSHFIVANASAVNGSGSDATPVHAEFVSNERREVDLSLMSRCNASIMTVGTFGWWGALMARGETLYYSCPVRAGSVLAKELVMSDYYLQNWRGLPNETNPNCAK